MVKEQFRETDGAKKISHITFGLMNPSQMQMQSHLNVVDRSLYNPETRVPMNHGVLDRRLGLSTNEKDKLCDTCGKGPNDCVGHFGHIDLVMPCFIQGFFRAIISILQCICKNCSRVLLPLETRAVHLRKVGNPNLSYLEKKSLRKKTNEACRKISICPFCSSYNGTVKKCAFLKIMHMKYKTTKKNEDVVMRDFLRSFDDVISRNKEVVPLLAKTQEILNPLMVYDLFCKIPDEDVPLLLMDRNFGRPENMIFTRVPVPPANIRPSVISDMKIESTEDDITTRLLDIVSHNIMLGLYKDGSNVLKFMETWAHLQIVLSQLYNSEISGIPASMNMPQQNVKQSRGFIQRLKGKQGRFRGNLSGKRVNFSGRTVISPDPNLRIDQVGVPEHVAKILTYPERVTPFNKQHLQKLILNGMKKHPGANMVEKPSMGGYKFNLFLPSAREKSAKELQHGDIVHRHLCDGDVILFNRQPSLHRLSIQAFYAKVKPSRTFSFNECCCNPFNADFDGDEMNLHLPQTEEAKAEALTLMGSKSNIITPRNGEPLIAAIQDFITGSYLLTQKDVFFNYERARFLASAIITRDDPSLRVELPPPAILKPLMLWTGKQLFSLIVRPNRLCPVKANLRAKCSGKRYEDKSKKEYRCPECCARQEEELRLEFPALPVPMCNGCVIYNKYGRKEEMDPNDMFVVINNSELLAGYMEKGNLGSGSKTNIFYVILRDFGEQYAADSLLRLSRLISAFIMNRGFTIGIPDVSPGRGLLSSKKVLLKSGYDKCDEHIKKFQRRELEAQPGFTVEETLEAVLLKELSDIREAAANSCLKELHKANSPLIMALCGSKGSNINISQMIACVGQQSVSGHRVPTDFSHRALPYFEKKSKNPAARGFVGNSFHSGLTPSEMFFHTVAGREGLVDTAVKTADTGYMQRRLIKTMEDLSCAYDGTVRNSMGDVVQFVYGSDGMDPIAMEFRYTKTRNKEPTDRLNWRPVDFNRLMYQVTKEFPCRSEKPLAGEDVRNLFVRHLQRREGAEMRKYKLSLEDVKKRKRLNSGGQSVPASSRMESSESRTQDFETDQHPERAKNFGRHLDKFIKGLISNISSKGGSGGKMSEWCNIERVTHAQLIEFFDRCNSKFHKAHIEPGTAVGALAAQSIGEPGTQMTLKTFHFAGVASMNITQGVPRIKEIINASKNISTPVVTCPLEIKDDKDFARMVKGRIEKTLLSQVSEEIQLHYLPDEMFILIKLALTRIQLLRLEINA